MEITIRYSAGLSDRVGTRSEKLETDQGLDILGLLTSLSEKHKVKLVDEKGKSPKADLFLTVNGRLIRKPTKILRDQDVVVIGYIAAGGS